jgi:thioredoxin-related protein
MKKLALILWMACVAIGARGEATWLTSVPDALAQAKRENKLVLLDFTGSDWCHWCMVLEADTFTQPQFIDYAKDNLVLARLDFPRRTALPDDLKAANEALRSQFGVEGFPTVVILSPDGKKLWSQTGYGPGGPARMLDAVNKCFGECGMKPRLRSAPQVAAVAPAPRPVAPAPAYVVSANQQYVAPTRKAGEEPKLQGVLYSPGHSAVVIDGKACEEGETVHGMRVIKIARHDVTVEFNGATKTLSVN